jgi:tripartite-type tricarboxylate transporter receptor subunit TctC
VSLLTDAPLLIVGKNALPAKDGKEFLAWLKANPDKASAATVGPAGAAHLCLVYFQNQTGTRFALVPYRGGAPVMQDLVANQIDLFCAEASQTREHLKAGRMKAFAVMAKSRWFGAPEVETIDEIGVPGVYISFWHGLWVPKGTPKPVIARLNAAVVESLADPAVSKRLTDLGQIIWSREQQTPDALRAHHRGEIEKWWPFIKAANIKVEAN